MSALVQCMNLTKCYVKGKAPAVSDLNLTIERGHIVGLLGPNGSGKTTLIKMMNGLLKPTDGVVLIGGSEPGVETKKHVSYLPERTYLEAYEMLQSLNIQPSDRLKTLSKGTKEKIQLILVMSRDADLYILDEPIAGVDPAARDYIMKTILNNYNPEASLIISTHLISDIESILDDVIFIKNGQLVLQASVDEIREKQGKTVDAYFREVFAC